MENPDTQQLTESLRQNDEAAFDALFRQWYAPLCRYAGGLTGGDLDEAEDIVQQVFVKLWEQRATLDVRWSVKAYLYKMVHNRCLNRLRDARVRDQYKQHNAAMLENGADHQPLAENELRERILRALDALPPQCRTIFELSRFEELKYREIADQLNLSVKTVEAQMGKALRLMRTQLSDYFVTLIGALTIWNLILPT